MSVTMSSPVDVRTSSSTRNPSSRPGPRKAPALVRFALSNDALKTSCKPRLSLTSFSCRAIFSACSRLSTTFGPAITKNGAADWPVARHAGVSNTGAARGKASQRRVAS
jgi:hypothetical protein